MFDRRLKIILTVLFTLTTVLVVRAGYLQVVSRHRWNALAVETLKDSIPVETTRGAILDRSGRPMALDVPGVSASVDYRAIQNPPDPTWLTELARAWCKQRRGDEYKQANADDRKKILEEEKLHVLQRLQIMWATLAKVSGKSADEIEEIRGGIVRKIELRRRYQWYRKYEQAIKEHQAKEPAPKWRSWLIDDAQLAPQLDQFEVELSEQRQAHSILTNIPLDTYNHLAKVIDDLPGLVLQPGVHREYRGGEAVAHLVGNLSRVRVEDLKNDSFGDDELRKLEYNDLIGRSGLESLCETLLRGTRGKIEKAAGRDGAVLSQVDPLAGKDIRTTIDLDLQAETLELFKQARVTFGLKEYRDQEVHGGAVVIDVRTGEVRALVSNPGFDPNRFDEDYSKLAADALNKPLMNRATQYPLEPGSTVKPVIGLGAITQGLAGVNEGIECTGYLTIGKTRYKVLRCWMASKFEGQLSSVAHHPIPVPHQGHSGNADGFLTLSDAIQRSCNVYFENLADRLKIDGVAHWMDQFGLGRPTGIGIAEASGRLPSTYRGSQQSFATWSSGIGQGPVSATTIQMANVAATIARDGIWMRPTLVNASDALAFRKSVDVPDRVDLKLNHEALRAAQMGMTDVVNSEAGTGTLLKHKQVLVAAKTGTAEAAALFVPVVDAVTNQPVLDENGRQRRRELVPSSYLHPNPEAPWYLGFGEDGKKLKHSWIIGYAPADDPQIAFAVMVEYGGGGGAAAAGIARQMLDACIEHGYLSLRRVVDDRR